MSRVTLVAVMLAGLGCQTEALERADARARASAPQQAREAVIELFAAFETGDCMAIAARLGPQLRAHVEGEGERCEAFLADEPLSRAEVVEIAAAKVDGRDPGAFLVEVGVAERGQLRPVVVRVERGPAGYEVVSL